MAITIDNLKQKYRKVRASLNLFRIFKKSIIAAVKGDYYSWQSILLKYRKVRASLNLFQIFKKSIIAAVKGDYYSWQSTAILVLVVTPLPQHPHLHLLNPSTLNVSVQAFQPFLNKSCGCWAGRTGLQIFDLG